MAWSNPVVVEMLEAHAGKAGKIVIEEHESIIMMIILGNLQFQYVLIGLLVDNLVGSFSGHRS